MLDKTGLPAPAWCLNASEIPRKNKDAGYDELSSKLVLLFFYLGSRKQLFLDGRASISGHRPSGHTTLATQGFQTRGSLSSRNHRQGTAPRAPPQGNH